MEPRNCAVKRLPACASLSAHREENPGSSGPTMVVVIPVRIKPACIDASKRRSIPSDLKAAVSMATRCDYSAAADATCEVRKTQLPSQGFEQRLQSAIASIKLVF